MWDNPTLFHGAKSSEKNIDKILTTDNAIYRDSLILEEGPLTDVPFIHTLKTKRFLTL